MFPGTVTLMGGEDSPGGYVFISWKTDHPPRHVHVYPNRKLIVKWDLDNKKPTKGKASKKLVGLIEELESEGKL
ncbi:MAG: hypothetical protein HY726_04825 [Candidatus Rokubacteria bacterium]|nr:hypothetical protein [Candidatus Rokubacteria bacterium]